VKQYTKLQSFIHNMNNHALSYRTNVGWCRNRLAREYASWHRRRNSYATERIRTSAVAVVAVALQTGGNTQPTGSAKAVAYRPDRDVGRLELSGARPAAATQRNSRNATISEFGVLTAHARDMT